MNPTAPSSDYLPRIVDRELDFLLAEVPAISLEGAKGVGKTATARRRARTTYRLDDMDERAVARGDPARLVTGETPILIDEWQRLPESWDLVRRAVDDDPRAGPFLLTGSATVRPGSTHSGAGRIITVRMRPLALSERGRSTPSVRIADLLDGGKPPIAGTSAMRLEDYADEILASGFPGLRDMSDRVLRARLDGYLDRIAEVEFPELGRSVRNPVALRRWMRAYAAATSTTATFETVRAAATGDGGNTPTRASVQAWLDVLERLWLVEPVPGWSAAGSQLRRLASPAKHQLADPALAARLLGATKATLLAAGPVGPWIPRDGPLLGALFESLVTLGVRAGAQAAESRVFHLRTKGGEHEVDLIVERGDGAIVAIEVKLARTIDDSDVRHLRWLAGQIGDQLLDAVVVTTGPTAYRRADGIAVVPAALLGP